MQISAQEITFIDRTGAEESYPLQGRYFYRRYGKEILLVGSRLEDGNIRIQEFPEGVASGAEWRLTINGDKASGGFLQMRCAPTILGGCAASAHRDDPHLDRP